MSLNSRSIQTVTSLPEPIMAPSKTWAWTSLRTVLYFFLVTGSITASSGISLASQSQCEGLFIHNRIPRSIQTMQALAKEMVLLYQQIAKLEDGLVKQQIHRDFTERWQKLSEEFGDEFRNAFEKRLSQVRSLNPSTENGSEKNRHNQKQNLKTAPDQVNLPGSHGIQIRENLVFSVHNQEMWLHDLVENSHRQIGTLREPLADHALQMTSDRRYVFAGLMNKDFVRIDLNTGQSEILKLGLALHEQPSSPPRFFVNKAGTYLTTSVDNVGVIIYDVRHREILSREPHADGSENVFAAIESPNGRFQMIRSSGMASVIFDFADQSWVSASALRKWSTYPLEGYAFSSDSQYFFFAKPSQGSQVSNWIFRGNLKTLEFEPWLEIPAQKATAGILSLQALSQDVVLISSFAKGVHYFRWDLASGTVMPISLPTAFSSSEHFHFDLASNSLYMFGKLRASVNKRETAILQIKFVDANRYETRMIQFTPEKTLHAMTMTGDKLFSQLGTLQFMNLEFAFSVATPEVHEF